MRTHRRSGLLLSGVVVAVVLLAVGATIAYLGYRKTAGPAGAVRGYFGALQRGDAPDALAYGDVPAGPRMLLTNAALAEQNRVAAIKGLNLRRIREHGADADVAVQYTLDFPGDPQQVDTTVALHRQGGEWRLDHVAVSTQLTLRRADQRATVLGTRLGDDPLLLFPGAAPVRLDTPYLQLSADDASVGFDAQPTTQIDVAVSEAGRRRTESAVDADLLACVSGRGPSTCPQPDERYVPGSLRGSLASPHPSLTIAVGGSPTGTIEVSGEATVVGTYRKLTFDNRVLSGKGRVRLPLHATSYAVAPLRFRWARPQDVS